MYSSCPRRPANDGSLRAADSLRRPVAMAQGAAYAVVRGAEKGSGPLAARERPMNGIDPNSFLVIVVAAAVAGTIVAALAPRVLIPVVVIELLLGIIIGPQVLNLAHVDDFTNFFGNLGLGMLFFFAGYEIDFERIRGRPLDLAVMAWVFS